MHWKSLVINHTTSLKTAMELIDVTGYQISLMVDEQQEFLGTLSDGDIRRALLAGAILSDLAKPFVNRSPIFLTEQDDDESIAYATMDRLALRCLPVIKENRIEKVYLDLTQKRKRLLENSVLIMAGGRGERLRPQTDEIPKPLIPVGGKPMIQILIERLASSGFHNIWISTHYLGVQIRDFLGNGEQFGVSINYIVEKNPLGTAGSYNKLPQSATSMPVLICNADVLNTIDFAEMLEKHNNSECDATIAVKEHYTTLPFGVVFESGDRLLSFREKPTFTNFIYSGIGILNRTSAVAFENQGAFDITDIYQDLIERSIPVNIYRINGYWRDLGTGESLNQANSELGVIDRN